jgi:regulator of sigma E protease
MTEILWNFASFIIALGVLVAVHEFGHFWVARRCGVKVEKFSIGFGKSLWSKTGKDGTEYSIALIPLGGYVKMLDGRVEEVPESQKHLAFDHKPLWQRSAVVAAGPAFNFLFAIVAYWLIFLLGVPTVKPVIGEVVPHSIVARAGIQPGMELKAVSGTETADWESVNMQLVSHIGDERMTLSVTSADEIGLTQTVELDISQWQFNPETESAMTALGFKPFSPEIYTSVAHVSDGGAAAVAGFMVGDNIIAIDDEPVSEWRQVVERIQASAERTLRVEVERNGQVTELLLTPESRRLSGNQVVGFAGIAPDVAEWPQEYRIDIQYGVFQSVSKAIEKTGQLIDLTFTMLKKLVTGDVGLENLSGPISIAKGAGTTADYGLVHFLGFLALISVNLGIINLVPLPVLDGGHLLFYAIEAIIRRPVPEKAQELGYRIGGAILFSLMAIAIFNDFMRL